MLWPLSVYTSVQRSFFAVEDEDEDDDYPGDDDWWRYDENNCGDDESGIILFQSVWCKFYEGK